MYIGQIIKNSLKNLQIKFTARRKTIYRLYIENNCHIILTSYFNFKSMRNDVASFIKHFCCNT